MAAAQLGDVVPPLDDRAHEAAVLAFLAKVPKRRRERAEAHHPVLTDRKARQVLKHESSWAGDVLDELLVVTQGYEANGLAPPGYVKGPVRQTLPALNLGRRVFTQEIDDEKMSY